MAGPTHGTLDDGPWHDASRHDGARNDGHDLASIASLKCWPPVCSGGASVWSGRARIMRRWNMPSDACTGSSVGLFLPLRSMCSYRRGGYSGSKRPGAFVGGFVLFILVSAGLEGGGRKKDTCNTADYGHFDDADYHRSCFFRTYSSYCSGVNTVLSCAFFCRWSLLICCFFALFPAALLDTRLCLLGILQIDSVYISTLQCIQIEFLLHGVCL